MRRLSILWLTCLLSACVVSPAEIMREGARYTFESPSPPPQFARCATRVIEEERPGSIVTSRTTEKPGEIELVSGASGHGALLVVLVRPAGRGSSGVIAFHPIALQVLRDPLAEAVRKAC